MQNGEIMKIVKEYEKGLEKLKQYLEVVNNIPSEEQWNRYAFQERLLSSKSLEYVYGHKFNVMCRRLIREVRGKKKKERKK